MEPSKSAEIFWRELEQGKIPPLPFCPALAEDVYAAYRCFCVSVSGGLVRPDAINRVIPTIIRYGQVQRITPYVPDPDVGLGVKRGDGKTWRPRRVLLIGQRRFELDEREDARRVVRGIREFRFALRAYQAQLPRAETESFAGRGVEGHPRAMSSAHHDATA